MNHIPDYFYNATIEDIYNLFLLFRNTHKKAYKNLIYKKTIISKETGYDCAMVR